MGICPFFANVEGDDTETKTGTVECRQAGCQIWNIEESNCSMAVTAKMTLHIHQGHLHNAPHPVEEIEDVEGVPVVPSSLPYAASIAQEYACFQDSDGNKKVFGLDFKFVVDEFLPPAIAGIQSNPAVRDKPIPAISWRDLFNWYYNGGADPLANVPSKIY